MNMNNPFNIFLSLCVRLTTLAIAVYIVYTFSKGKPSGYIILVGLLFAYLFYYFVGRQYLIENYENNCLVDSARPFDTIVKENDVILDTDTAPYLNKPIDSIDDYEYNLVFENENDKELNKDLRNKLMSQYPMDWSTQPASSSFFTKGQKESFQNSMPIDLSQNELVYKNISGSNLQPPDTDSVEKKEREILQTYQPKNVSDLTTYNIEDANALIKKIYDAKGQVAQVEHTEGTNIYEITGVRNKNEKIQYEDDLGDATASTEDVSGNMENVTVIPDTATDLLNASDPFYNIEEKTRMDKFNYYGNWTPELERSFAPTYPLSQWY